MEMENPCAKLESELRAFTDEERKCPVIAWYRSPLPPGALKALHERSDGLGAVQALGHLALIAAAGGLAVHAFLHWPWWAVAVCVFAYGMITSFLINAVHELGHGTVFRTRALNGLFVHVFAFLGWINHEMFQASHARHHRYTLHPPDDLEVVLPIRLMIRHFFLTGFLNAGAAWNAVKETVRIARGRFRGEWEMTLFPESAPEKRIPPVRWARILLTGHALIAVIFLGAGLWIVPVLVSGGTFIGGWLFFLCNNTQHIGMQDNVPDFRLCCRTFLLNPVVRFLYWQMNYHTEHHMYAAVPCYRLGRLHRLIAEDLPPPPNGLLAVWREISTIQARMEKDPSYQFVPVLPQKNPRSPILRASPAS